MKILLNILLILFFFIFAGLDCFKIAKGTAEWWEFSLVIGDIWAIVVLTIQNYKSSESKN